MQMGLARHSVLLAVAVATVAACQGAPVTPVAPADSKIQTQPAQAPSEAQRLGLTKANVPMTANGFQVQGSDRRAVKSAVISIADQRLTTDENGVFHIPDAAIASGEPIIALIEAEGAVPIRKRLLPGMAVVMQPLDSATTFISATQGGVAVNSDGTMLIEFGPGALDHDANVGVTRTFVANPPSNEAMHPAFVRSDAIGFRASGGYYGYHMELDGAKINPGTSVIVRFKAEGVMLDYLSHLDAENVLDKFEIGKEVKKSADGTFYLNMIVPAPLAAPDIQNTSKYSLLGVVCNQWFREPEYYQYPVTTTERFAQCVTTRIQTGTNAQGQPIYTTLDAQHDSRANGGGCVYEGASGCNPWPTFQWTQWFTGVRYWDSSTINAYVNYQSDDSRINGKALSGAQVYFSHGGTPVRAATSSAITGSDGYCNGVGKLGASGTASAYYGPDASYTYSTNPSYSVNCGTVNPRIVKNKGQLALSFSHTGTPVSGSVAVGSSHGNLGLSGFSNQTIAVAHNNIANVTENVTLNGGNWTLNGYQVDMNPSSGTTKWNTTNGVGLSVWHNATLTANLKYASNDTTVPADQQPATKWNAQPVSGANVTFAHPVSTSAMKPAGRDTLSFTGVNSSQAAWGIRGSNSSVSANLTANGITLSGSNTAPVDNTTVNVLLGANLPKLAIPFTGEFNDPVVISYRLDDGTSKTINLPAPTGSAISFHLPIEDALNNPKMHQLSIVSISNPDFSRILAVQEPDGALSTAYPEIGSLRRGGQSVTYNTLIATTNAAK